MNLLVVLKRSLMALRILQVCSALAIVIMFAYLTGLIAANRLGLTSRMIAIETMSGISLLYFVPVLVRVIKYGRDSQSTSAWSRQLIILGAADLVLALFYIGIIIIMTAAGLPANCYGLTRQNWNSNDAPNDPQSGYTTIRFGPGLAGQQGELDYLCPLGIASFGLSFVIILFLFLSGIVAGYHYIVCRFLRGSKPGKDVGNELPCEEGLDQSTGLNGTFDVPKGPCSSCRCPWPRCNHFKGIGFSPQELATSADGGSTEIFEKEVMEILEKDCKE
jgi:hypothetical protein